MARISSYDQDATLNQNDKLLGTDSLTGVTKNFSIDSIFSIAGDVIDMFDGPIYKLQNFKAAGSDNLYGVLSFNAGAASNTSFANVSIIYFSIEDVGEHSLANYFDALNGHYFRIAKKGDLDTFGIYEVTNVEDYESGAYKKLTVSLIRSNGSIALNEKVFLSSHTEKHLLDLNTKSVEDLGDVTSVGSGQIITTAERSNLVNLNNNALLHADVVNNLTTVTTDVPLAANQGKLLKDEVDAINTLLTSDNVSLDTLQEVVDFIEANKDSLDNLTINNISGLQSALDAKENSVTGKGLSTNDFTDASLNKLNGIAFNAEVNVQANWSENVTTSDAFIQNKPTDLTTLNTHNVTELSDITDAGSGAIITGAERTKLSGIASGAEVNVQANWNETDSSSDAFIQNKPTVILSASSSVTDLSDVTSAGSGAIITSAERTKLSNAVEESRNFQISGTTNQIQVNPSTPQDLSANRSVTVSLPSDVTINNNLTVSNNLSVDGNLTVSGTTTTVNTTNLNIEDNIITLNNGQTGTPSASLRSGIEIERGDTANAILQFNENTDKWEFSTNGGSSFTDIGTPADSEIETAYNNQVSQISSSERTAGTETGVRRFAPADIKSMVDTHGLTLTDLSVGSPASASGSGAIAYNNSTGVFTYTPPDLSNNVTGAGQANLLAIWSGSNNLTSDQGIVWDGMSSYFGINNTSPSETLDVTGTAAISGDLKIDTDTLYVDVSSDLVGIGTSSPGEELHIKKTQEVEIKLETGANYSKKITFYDGSSNLGEIRSNTNTGLAFYEKGTEVLNLDASSAVHVKNTDFKVDTDTLFVDESADKVGINTASPSEALDVVGNGKFSGKIYFANMFSQISDLPSASTYHGMFAHVHATGKAYFAHGGNWIELVDTNTALLDGTGSANKVAFWTDSDTLSNDSQLHWDSSNNRLGVNVSSPQDILDVGGSITMSDSTYGDFRFTRFYGTPQFLAGNTNTVFRFGHTSGSSGIADGDLISLAAKNIGLGESNPQITLDAGNKTDAIKIPVGTTAQRPTGAAGMFRYNSTEGQFEGYTTEWGAIAGSSGSSGSSGSGSGSTTISVDAFNGDGNTTAFTLSNTITSEDNTQVYVDGVYQSKDTYSTSGTTLTFSEAPPTGTGNIEVVHLQAVSVSSTSGVTQNSFTGDGTTTAFTLSQSPTDENFTFVFIQGVYQDKSTYSLSGSTLTFSTAPQNGYGVEVMAIGAVNIQQTSYLEYDNFTGNGSTTSFNLANGSPSDEKFTMVYIQGVYQEKSTYSLSSGNVVFSTAPQNGYTIEVMSINGGGLQTAQPGKSNVQVISSDTTAAGHNYLYVFTASLTLTLPASPEVGDSIKISNRSGVATCVLGANGNKIMGAAADLTLDTASASFELIYSGTDQGWVIIGQ